ncbi:MAG: hypothetical protein J6C41_00975 [Oscillospiraceae bacterium]|nr:hypothetical protein [Oscillospiraceae bacterium]
MEQELFLSGYCRNLDHSRMVCVVTEDRNLTEVDCDYPCCPYIKECSIAKHIAELT